MCLKRGRFSGSSWDCPLFRFISCSCISLLIVSETDQGTSYNASVFQVISYNDYRVELIEKDSQEAKAFDVAEGIATIQFIDLSGAYRDADGSSFGDVSVVIDRILLEYPVSLNLTQSPPANPMPLTIARGQFVDSSTTSWTRSIRDGQISGKTLRSIFPNLTLDYPEGTEIWFTGAVAYARNDVPKSKLQIVLSSRLWRWLYS